jgi:hypothetical protein
VYIYFFHKYNFFFNVSHRNAINTDYTSYLSIEAQLQQANLQIALDTTVVDSTKLANLEGLTSQLSNLSQSIDTLLDSYSSQRNTNLQGVQTLVNGLPATKPYETAWIAMFNAGIKQGQGIDLSNAERNQLIEIARTCPTTVGYASRNVLVFMPFQDRALFPDWEDVSSCTQTIGNRSVPESATPITLLYPNPADDYIIANIPWETGEGNWMILSMDGRTIKEGNWTTGQSEIDINLSTLSAGVYVLQITHSFGERQVTKFTIVK